MNSIVRIASPFALVCVVACGGGGPASFGAPTCGTDEVAISGTVGGTDVTDSRQNSFSYQFTNGFGDTPGSLIISFGGNDRLFVEWEGFALPNEPVAARGSLNFSDGGGINVTFCDASGFSGEFLAPDEENDVQGEFRFVDLRTSEPACQTPSVGGELVGCFRQ